MTVSLALDGEGLGTAWGHQKACELLAEAGFTSVDVKEIDGDLFNYYFVARDRRRTRRRGSKGRVQVRSERAAEQGQRVIRTRRSVR